MKRLLFLMMLTQGHRFALVSLAGDDTITDTSQHIFYETPHRNADVRLECKLVKSEFVIGEEVVIEFTFRQLLKESGFRFYATNPFLEPQWPCLVGISVFDDQDRFLGWIRKPDGDLTARDFPPPESAVELSSGSAWHSLWRCKTGTIGREQEQSPLFTRPGRYKIVAVCSGRFVYNNQPHSKSDPRFEEYSQSWAESRLGKELCRSSIAEIEILDASIANKPDHKTPPDNPLPLVGCSILSVKKQMINNKPCLAIEARLDNRSKKLVCVQQWWLCGRKPSLSVMALPITDRQGQFVMDLARADDLMPVKGIQTNFQGTGRYKLDVARLPPNTAITQIITTGDHIPTGQWRITLEYDKQLFIRKQDAMQALGDRNSTHQALFSPDPPEGIVTIKSEPFDFEIP